MQFSRHFLYNVIDIFVQDYFALVENEEILNKRASNKKRLPSVILRKSNNFFPLHHKTLPFQLLLIFSIVL